MILGEGNLGCCPTRRSNRSSYLAYRFRLALADMEALERSRRYLAEESVMTDVFSFSEATPNTRAMMAIRNRSRAASETIAEIIEGPTGGADDGWWRGFLAGIFDAEGSCSHGVWRLSNHDLTIIACVQEGLDRYAFDHTLEGSPSGCHIIRLRGGWRGHLRSFHLTDPAIRRTADVEAMALESDADLRVVSVEPLGLTMLMVDITTGTGDLIANGVVSHNCFARPSHTWLGSSLMWVGGRCRLPGW